MIATIVLPAISGRAPTSSAAAIAAPDEMPTGMPSLLRNLARGLERRLVGDGDDLVDDLAVEDAGHEARADALDLVRAGLTAGEHGRILGLERDHLHGRLLLPSALRRRR